MRPWGWRPRLRVIQGLVWITQSGCTTDFLVPAHGHWTGKRWGRVVQSFMLRVAAAEVSLGDDSIAIIELV